MPIGAHALVDHAERLSDALSRRLEPEGVRTFLLVGKDDVKTRRQKLSELSGLPQEVRFCIVATASYIGEGTDGPRLDTLFLAAPVSRGGLLTQKDAYIAAMRVSMRLRCMTMCMKPYLSAASSGNHASRPMQR